MSKVFVITVIDPLSEFPHIVGVFDDEFQANAVYAALEVKAQVVNMVSYTVGTVYPIRSRTGVAA